MTTEGKLMGKAETAVNTFSQGFNCTQAVLSAFSQDFGLDPVMAYKVAGPFGGGMGHLGKTCGAVTGAFMALGLKYSKTRSDGTESHHEAFAMVRQFVKEFESKHGSIECRELLGFNINDRQAFREAIQNGIPQKVCPLLVADAAAMVEKLLE